MLFVHMEYAAYISQEQKHIREHTVRDSVSYGEMHLTWPSFSNVKHDPKVISTVRFIFSFFNFQTVDIYHYGRYFGRYLAFLIINFF